MKCMVRGVTIWIIGIVSGIVFMIYRCGYILENSQKRTDKFISYFNLLDRWMTCKEQEHPFTRFFDENDIKSVAIYGLGKIGRHLKYELEKAGITISYVIDEEAYVIDRKEEYYNLRDNLPIVDIVVVTPIYEYEEIRKKILNNNNKLKVVSIEKII
ncbi:MAG: hypothetical protein NC489_15090 [Ruminococcus flavefaciens]|nr:hypothetical protein [Roseburia sp.]MCM1231443.1 hypothetical protein [Ruminococcus flavefaciens]